MAGLTFKGHTTLIDFDSAATKRHTALGGAVGWLSDGVFGVEAIGLWVPGFFQTGTSDLIEQSRVMSLMGNVVVTAPRRWTEYSLRPFVSGGVGVVRAKSIDRLRVLPFDATFNSVNVGGGAVGFLTQRTGVRFDLRYYRTMRGQPDEEFAIGGEPRLRFMTASIGVVLRR